MKPGARVITSAGTLRDMTLAQFAALQENILAEGRWDHANEVIVLGSDPVAVIPYDDDDKPIMMIGIEPDGYTHS